MLNLEEIDLVTLARALRQTFGAQLEEDYLDGRRVLRDAVADLLQCSELEAEELVDTLESREYLSFPRNADDTHPNALSRWEIDIPAGER